MIKKLSVYPELSIRDAISALVEGGKRTVFVVSDEGKLLGLFTNGDMRRYHTVCGCETVLYAVI